jgi:hypothetical protein
MLTKRSRMRTRDALPVANDNPAVESLIRDGSVAHSPKPAIIVEETGRGAKMARTIQEEVDRNYEVFRQLLPTIIQEHRGAYALMREGDIVTYFTTAVDARTAGEQLFPDGLFSIQQVTDTAINLGYFSYAVPLVQLQS